MSNEQLTSVLEMSGEERYDYFLSQVLEDREVWILINSENRFLSIVSDDDGLAHLPVWPSSEFAVEYAKGSDDLTPKSLSLPDFFRKWVPGLSKDGLQVGVFPGADQTLWITEADELKKDLQAELSSF
ncbi:DUF2750 domain-containing protein [Marinobacter piscensis]|uniref:DUF2750 domain-containing protein n=1 Tax=Marinobacter piscensis TaxID=1562308 RepID=UPI00119D0C8F|nr:DUF2750 domain-containing protein [Marinobacter piscensis]